MLHKDRPYKGAPALTEHRDEQRVFQVFDCYVLFSSQLLNEDADLAPTMHGL